MSKVGCGSFMLFLNGKFQKCSYADSYDKVGNGINGFFSKFDLFNHYQIIIEPSLLEFSLLKKH